MTSTSTFPFRNTFAKPSESSSRLGSPAGLGRERRRRRRRHPARVENMAQPPPRGTLEADPGGAGEVPAGPQGRRALLEGSWNARPGRGAGTGLLSGWGPRSQVGRRLWDAPNAPGSGAAQGEGPKRTRGPSALPLEPPAGTPTLFLLPRTSAAPPHPSKTRFDSQSTTFFRDAWPMGRQVPFPPAACQRHVSRSRSNHPPLRKKLLLLKIMSIDLFILSTVSPAKGPAG